MPFCRHTTGLATPSWGLTPIAVLRDRQGIQEATCYPFPCSTICIYYLNLVLNVYFISPTWNCVFVQVARPGIEPWPLSLRKLFTPNANKFHSIKYYIYIYFVPFILHIRLWCILFHLHLKQIKKKYTNSVLSKGFANINLKIEILQNVECMFYIFSRPRSYY